VKTKVFVISGPSGSGKTTLLEKALKKRRIKARFFRVITYTTRQPRPGEVPGKDYVFIEKSEFLRLQRKKFFAESKNILGNYYGTPFFMLIDEAQKKGKYPILCIDVQGAMDIKKHFGKNAVLIFIMPPSVEELEKRLNKRGAENSVQIKKRLLLAQKEVKYANKYNYIIENKNIRKALESLSDVLLKEADDI
jgi:guanylate kinase